MKKIDATKINDLGQALTIIEELVTHIDRLEEVQFNYALDLWEGIEFILQDKNLFPTINKQSLKVFDPIFKEFLSVDFMADNIVCIIAEPKSRKKHIYTYETEAKIKHYIINDNEMKFEVLRERLDKLSTHLVIVSKSTIVNVKFYDKEQNKYLVLKPEYKFDAYIEYKPSNISRDIGLENFIKVKEGLENRILLQKRASHYKNENELQ